MESPLAALLYDDGDLDALAAAWAEPQTFAWVPRRGGVDEAWLRRRLALLPSEHRADRFVLLTSGSTGLPKLVIGDRRRTEAMADVLHEAQRLERVAQAIASLPLTYTYAFVNQWVWSRRFGRTLITTDGLRAPNRLRAALEGASAAMVCLVGAQVPLLRSQLRAASFEGVIRVNFAGGAFPQSDLGYIRQLFPNAVIRNNYGCAEAMPRLTLREACQADQAEDVGQPLPGVELRVDELGQVVFRSAYGCVGQIDESGYRPFADADWIATGDLGEIDCRGHLLLRGRTNEVFKRYGEKIALPQLLRSVATVWKDAAAFYRQADGSGEPGHVLVLSPQPDKTTVRALLRELRAHYPRTHWPLRIEGVDRLPMLDNGKVDVLATAALPGKIVYWNQRI